MQDPNIENTSPTRSSRSGDDTVPIVVNLNPVDPLLPLEGTQPTPAAVATSGKAPRRWPWFVLGIFLILAFGVIGIWQGYNSAAVIRANKFKEMRSEIATEHFMAGLVAQENKQFEIARSQYEYVIQIDPGFPGAQDKLREVMIESAVKNTPTPVPTEVPPTLTPTLDMRPQEEIFAHIKQLFNQQDWNGVFDTVDALRRMNPSYQAVQVDGMLYFAYRFRGVDKIIHQANLEGGLYDLALAERFAPLDVDALGYRNWARMYLNGASFWGVDWEKVMLYFAEIYPYFPNMRDLSGMTAVERYRIAARSQGDKLDAAGNYCEALDFYDKSLEAVPDAEVEAKKAEVYLKCYPPTEVPTATPVVTLTPTVIITPTETIVPSPEPTTESTAEPTKENSSP